MSIHFGAAVHREKIHWLVQRADERRRSLCWWNVGESDICTKGVEKSTLARRQSNGQHKNVFALNLIKFCVCAQHWCSHRTHVPRKILAANYILTFFLQQKRDKNNAYIAKNFVLLLTAWRWNPIIVFAQCDSLPISIITFDATWFKSNKPKCV